MVNLETDLKKSEAVVEFLRKHAEYLCDGELESTLER